jgi:hypothetical protein
MTVGSENDSRHKIDIIIVVSSPWRLIYLESCLRSLNDQLDIDFASFGVTLVCMHREDVLDATFQPAVTEFLASKKYKFGISAEFCLCSGEGFPLSLARNIGARKSTGDIVGFVDSDLVIDPMTISQVLKLVPEHCKVAYSMVFRMPHRPPHEIYAISDINVFRTRRGEGKFEKKGKGSACFFIDHGLFFKMRGYDERLVGWGFADDDMMIRLGMLKTHMIDMTGYGISAMHQYHDTYIGTKYNWKANRSLSLGSASAIRNDECWGRGPKTPSVKRR